MSAAAANADELLERERRRIDGWLEGVAGRDVGRLGGTLTAPLRYAISGGGKRLRGTLAVLSYRALGGAGEQGIDDVACAIELVHTYSLVHDDLPCMDDDDLRRGRPTLHRVFGDPTAMATGAALIPLAFRILVRGAGVLGLRDGGAAAMVRTLARAIGGGGMVGGQWLDLEAEHRPLDLAALARVHEAKTGALFAAALGLGARAARAEAPAVAACEGYGAALGLAFQVVDDVLDETAETTVLGKTAGKDRRQEKATYTRLLGIDGARARARTAVEDGIRGLRAAGIMSAELEAAGHRVLARDH